MPPPIIRRPRASVVLLGIALVAVLWIPLVFALDPSLDYPWEAYVSRHTAYLAISAGLTAVIALLGLLAIVMTRRTEQANDALHRSEAHLVKAQRLGGIGSYERYLGSETIFWSPEIYRMFGFDPTRDLPSVGRLRGSIHPEDLEWLERSGAISALTQGDDYIEYRIIRADGTIRFVRQKREQLIDERGIVLGRVGTIQDVTVQKHAEMQHRLLRDVSLAIAAASGFDDALAIVLKTVCTMSDWSYAEAWVPDPGKAHLLLRAVWHTADQKLADLAESRLDQRMRPNSGHVTRAWQSGTAIWLPDLHSAPPPHGPGLRRAIEVGLVSSYAVPITSNEEIVAVLRFSTLEHREWDQGLTESITAVAAQLGTALARKQAEQALIESERLLQHGQKMQAIGTLTGGLAHDFNNLLAIIVGNLDLLADEIGGRRAAEELCDQARQAALRGGELTRSLLAFARRQPLSPQSIDLNERVGSVARMLQRVLGEQIEFQLLLADDLGYVTIDPVQLETAITNLATNARDAMPQGGRLTIKTRSITADSGELSSILDAKLGCYAVIDIADTGTGISAEAIDHIFEPFFTTKDEGKGSGLGLSMVFGFIRQSGGYVTVDSQPGIGTHFRLYLPQGEKRPVSPAAEASHAEAIGRGETILVVEDNDAMRSVVTRQLQRLGYRTLAAANAGDAITLLSEEPAIDLVFTDVVMPGRIDGLGLAREIRRHHPWIKVLLTSGFPESAPFEELADYRLLGKPYRKEELAAILRELLDDQSGSVPRVPMVELPERL